MICLYRTLLALIIVAGIHSATASDVCAQTPLSPAAVEENLANFFQTEMNLRRSSVHVDNGVVFLAFDIEGLDAETIVGATSLMLSTAGGAAPWSSEVRISVFEKKALLYQVAVDTSAISNMLSGQISEQQFVARWRFAPDSTPGKTATSTTKTGTPKSGTPKSGTPGIGTGTSSPLVLTLTPSADTHVYAYAYRNWNVSNWGRYEVLGAGWNPIGGEKRTFIRFDLAGINLNDVVSAKLRLFRYHLAGDGARALGVFRVTSPWREGRGTYKPASAALPGEVTWRNQPSFDPRSPSSFSSVGASPTFIDVDVTWLIKAWASGFENHGLMLRPAGHVDASHPEAMFGFHSREHKDANTHPKLLLNVRNGNQINAGNVVTGNSITGNTVIGNTITGNTVTGNALPGNAVNGNTTTSNTQTSDPTSGTTIRPGDTTWDFETGDLRGWTATGTAFQFQPTYGDNPAARNRGQPSSHGGRYWIGGYEKYQGKPGEQPGTVQGDGPTGTLTSNRFVIANGSMEFLVGGGASIHTRVELLVDGQPMLQASGRNNETMQKVKWDLSPWAGRSGQVRLVDNSSGGWGHINTDEFRFMTGNPNSTSAPTTNPSNPTATEPTVSTQSGLVTDGDWKVTTDAPRSEDWMFGGFDDRNWQNAIPDWRLRPAPQTHISGMSDTSARWIWHESDPDLAYFRREFSVGTMQTEAKLRITADNDYIVYVNGMLVGEDAGNQVSVWNTAEAYDVTQFISQGRNVVAVIARDLGGGSGLLVDLRFVASEPVPLSQPDQIDESEVEILVPPIITEPQGNVQTNDQTPEILVQQAKAALADGYQHSDPTLRADAFTKAKTLLEQAQSTGSAEALYLLGFMYETGNGAPHDNDVAISYYEKSARGGFSKAYRQIILVQNQLNRHSEAAITFFRYYKAFPQEAMTGFDDYAYNPDVLKAVQRELRRSGHYRGAIDGIVGSGTLAAIEHYASEMIVDEIIEPNTIQDQHHQIIEAASLLIARDLAQTVRLDVEIIRTDGSWAYLQATPRQPNGAPIDWNRTRFGRQYQDGMLNDVVMVLLRSQNGVWQVVDHIIGPNDVYWYGWIERYRLPESLFH